MPSVFGNQPAATPEEVGIITTTLAACFPQMPSMFWGLVAKQACALCLSKARLEYVATQLMLNHTYPTLTMADIFGIDKNLHIFTYDEYMELTLPHRPLARITYDGKTYVVYLDEARDCGYQYTPIESYAERRAREDKARQERWEKEFNALPQEEKDRINRLAEERAKQQ